MARVLSIDFGLKRTGLAVTDPLQIIASGLTTIPTHELEQYLETYFQSEEVEGIVIGWPFDLKGNLNEIHTHISGFIKRFEKKYPTKFVKKIDERFTSSMAQQSILKSGTKKKKRQEKGLIDMVSATIILQSYMNQY